MNTQREVIYQQRREVLDGEDLKDTIQTMTRNAIADHVAMAFGEAQAPGRRRLPGDAARPGGAVLPQGRPSSSPTDDAADKTPAGLHRPLPGGRTRRPTRPRRRRSATPLMRELERVIMLRVVDEYWMDHIDAMDDLTPGHRPAGLRPAPTRSSPTSRRATEHVRGDDRRHPGRDRPPHVLRSGCRRTRRSSGSGWPRSPCESVGGDGTVKKQPVKKVNKIGRNDPCPCGSGLKWKKCTCKEYHDN